MLDYVRPIRHPYNLRPTIILAYKYTQRTENEYNVVCYLHHAPSAHLTPYDTVAAVLGFWVPVDLYISISWPVAV